MRASPAEADKPAAEKAEPAPPPPSACRLALTEAIAIAPSIPAINGPGSCGGDDLVRLEAVVLAGQEARRGKTRGDSSLRHGRGDRGLGPVGHGAAGAEPRHDAFSELDNFDSFECRGRNRVSGAKMSEHGRANALDIRGLKFANGQSLSLTDRGVAREQREAVLHSVCARFTTVLGPGSDWYHEDHIHLDLAERRSGYRICQWNVYDPMPRDCAVAAGRAAGGGAAARSRREIRTPPSPRLRSRMRRSPTPKRSPSPQPKPRPTKKRRRAGAF